MTTTTRTPVLTDLLGASEGAALRLRQAVLVVLGVAALAIAAKIRVPLGTFAVLTIGAAYGARLGLVTILAYMAIGALGFDVFANSSAEKNGLAYMLGGTGGYLLGFVLATGFLGFAARRGWDRSVVKMALAISSGASRPISSATRSSSRWRRSSSRRSGSWRAGRAADRYAGHLPGRFRRKE